MSLRHITPSLLALGLVCFFLPWTEIRCNNGAVLTHSGFQMACGSATYTPSPAQGRAEPTWNEPDWEKASGWMIVYGLCLLAGTIVGCFAVARPLRERTLLVVTTTALVMLALQTRRLNEVFTTKDVGWNELSGLYTPWFAAAWVLTAAALLSAATETWCGARRFHAANRARQIE